jgi:drug/metabolite transporter (DMT)-like permease
MVKGWGAALLTVTLFSLVPGLTRLAIQAGFSPLQLLTLRLLAALVLLGLHLLLTRTSLHLSRQAFGAAVAVGLFSAAGELALFNALQYLPAGIVTILLAAIPLVVMGLLAGRGAPLYGQHWLRLGLGVAGIGTMIVSVSGRVGNFEAGAGLLLALAAVLLFGLQYALTEWYLADQPPVPVAFYGVLAAAAPTTLSYGWAGNVALPDASLSAWLAVGLLCVGATYIARLSFLAAVRYLGSVELALLLPLEMFAGVGWAVWLLGEPLVGPQWLGGGLTALSALMGVYTARPRSQSKEIREVWQSRGVE